MYIVILHEKRDFADVAKLRNLRWGDKLSWWSSMHLHSGKFENLIVRPHNQKGVCKREIEGLQSKTVTMEQGVGMMSLQAKECCGL